MPNQIDVNVPRHEVYVNGMRVFPTLKEFRLLHVLKSADGCVLTRDQLLTAVWKKRADSRTVDQHIARLRKKIGADAIETVAGLGYKFSGV